KHALRLHDQIETEVFTLSFGPDAVGLDAERIEVKLVRSSLVVESVEENADVVVVPDVVALRDVGAHFRRIVETMKCEVEKVRIVAEPDFGFVLRDEIVARLDLVEVLQHGGSERAALPVFAAGAVAGAEGLSLAFSAVKGAGDGCGVGAEESVCEAAAEQYREIRTVHSNAAFMKTFPYSRLLLERFPLIWTPAVQRIFQSKRLRFFSRKGTNAQSQTLKKLVPLLCALRLCGKTSLLAWTQKNFSLASPENKYF